MYGSSQAIGDGAPSLPQSFQFSPATSPSTIYRTASGTIPQIGGARRSGYSAPQLFPQKQEATKALKDNRWSLGTPNSEKKSKEESSSDELKETSSSSGSPAKGGPLFPDHIAPLTPSLNTIEKKPYSLRAPTAAEREETLKLLKKSPKLLEDFDIVSMEKVDDPELSDQFEKKMVGLSRKAFSEALKGTWENKGELETRRKVHADLEKIKCRTNYEEVFTLNAFHGAKSTFLDQVLSSGIDFTGKTDDGYFGQGPYLTTFPYYALTIYSKGHWILLKCKICFRRLYPVASCDELKGQGIVTGFDGHMVHVTPKSNRTDEMYFESISPIKDKIYDEFVLRDSSQVLIDTVIKFKPKPAYEKMKAAKQKDLQELIGKYLAQKPDSEQFAFFSQKITELGQSENAPLTISEIDMYSVLQRSIDDPGVKTHFDSKIARIMNEETFARSLSSKREMKGTSKEKNIALLEEADCLRYEGKLEDAFSKYQKILKGQPSIQAQLGCGDIFLKQKKYDQAIEQYNQVVALEPKNGTALKALVSCYIAWGTDCSQQNNFLQATKLFSKAFELDSKNLLVIEGCAASSFSLGMRDDALLHCERALKINPNNLLALRVKGAIFAEIGRNEEALRLLTRSIELKPTSFLFLTRGRLFLAMGKIDEADKDCQSLFTFPIREEDVSPHFLRGKISLSKGEKESALKDLKFCYKKDKSNLAFILALGDFYTTNKEPKNALKFYNQFMECYTNIPMGDRKKHQRNLTLAFIGRANAYLLTDSRASALNDLNAAIGSDPDSPEVYSQRRLYYQQIGDQQKADEDFKTALSKKKKNYSPV